MTEVEPDWEHVKKCVVIISNDLAYGQGIVISPYLIMTALHGSFGELTPFTITALESEARTGYVLRQWYEPSKVDITLIKLNVEQVPFTNWLGVLSRPLRIDEEIAVVSLQTGLSGGLDFAFQRTRVYMLDSNTALCRAQYYAMDGLSGAGAITGVQRNGEVVVIGVHVASHDDSEKPPAIKRSRQGAKTADFESVSSTTDSLAKSVHGHTAYCLICIANMVEELMATIANDHT
jgi:hypothetical protein